MLVYKFKLAIFYLTDAVEMGYKDATYELSRAHLSLSSWYSSELASMFDK